MKIKRAEDQQNKELLAKRQETVLFTIRGKIN